MCSTKNSATKHKFRSTIKNCVLNFPAIHGTLLVAKKNDILWHQGFSYSDAPINTDKNSQYLIASITKQFTAAALLKALYDTQAKNVTSALHHPISTWVPQGHHIWQGSAQKWINQITLHHLLTHTSGIKKLCEPLEFEPSTKYAYSNVSYTLLGTIIQTLTAESLNAYFERVLFAPAGMYDTALPAFGNPADLKQITKFQKLSLGFERKITDEKTEYAPMGKQVNFDKPSTSGGIISTAVDLVKWHQALYYGNIIPMPLVGLMTKKYIQKETYQHYDGFETLWYGYGLDIYEQSAQKIYQHCGGIAGYQSKLYYNPQTMVTIVNLSNIAEENPSIFSLANRLQGLF